MYKFSKENQNLVLDKEFTPLSLLSRNYDVYNVRPPFELVHQQFIPKILSRQTSLSILSVATSSSSNDFSRDRIGMENDLPNSVDIERQLEMNRMQDSLTKHRRSNPQLMISNYSYDPHLHLHTLNEERSYTSSNMDDLIDSMARRHLASRRLDAAIDRQRHTNGYHGQNSESLNTDRTTYRNDDSLYTNRSTKNQTEYYIRTNPQDFNQMLRARIDYYNRIQPDLNGIGNDDSIHASSYTKLPPISSGKDSNHLNHIQNSSTNKNNSHRKDPNSSDRSEHLIDLPSDIFISSRTKASNSSRRRSISKDTRSETDRSGDDENEISLTNRYKKNLQNDNHGFFTDVNNNQQKTPTKYRRNLFQKVAIGILFIIILKHQSRKNRSRHLKQPSYITIHKIRLQEIIVALHRVYLEPDGPIYNALIQAINNSISLQNGLNKSSKYYQEAIDIIGNTLKNVISKIIEFMPKDGVLGTGKTSAVSALIQNGNQFPENYFWQCERELLEFNNLKIINITKQRAILLLIGIFIFRSLVTTLLIKPIKYRLILGQLTSTQSANLKVLASVILYIGRRAAGPKSHMLALPNEWQLSLYSDANIQTIIQHSEIKSIIDTCEQSLRMWCEEYIRRIDESFNKELRL